MEKQPGHQTREKASIIVWMRSFWKSLLAISVILFMVTSGMVGYMLGKNASTGTGALIDTIVLSPGETANTQVHHFLSGKLLYSGGEPCARARIELGQEALVDTTDSTGKFFFSGVQAGAHAVRVYDNNGDLLVSSSLKLEFSQEQTGTVLVVDGGASLKVPENTRMVDITLKMEEDTFSIDEGASYLVTTDGEIVDFEGGRYSVKNSSLAVTPAGNVVTSEGYMLLPSRQVVITPPGGEEAAVAGTESVPGIEVLGDGSAQTPSGVVINQDSTVVTPDEETVKPEDSVVVIDGDIVEIIDKLPQIEPENSSQTSPAIGANEGSSSSQSQPEEPSASEEEPEASPVPEGENQIGDEPTPEPTPNGISVEDLSTGTEWRQQSFIDLFKNRVTPGTLNGGKDTEEGLPVISPGSTGVYDFRLKNENDFPIIYTIRLSEETFHLPIEYSVVDSITNYPYLDGSFTGEDKGIATSTITLEANSQRDYRIIWNWEYSTRYQKNKTDAMGTEIAMKDSVEDRTYILTVSINAAELINKDEIIPDGDVKYPGRR